MNTTIKHTILVVEDSVPLANAAKIKLQQNNCNVYIVSRVDNAIKYLEDNKDVNAIWLDHYLLGDKSGYDLVEWLNNDEFYKDTPVFFISNTVADDKIQDYMNAGITKYYVKSDHSLDEIIGDILAELDSSS